MTPQEKGELQRSDSLPAWERTRRQQARADLSAWATRPWLFTAITGVVGAALGWLVGAVALNAETPAENLVAVVVGLLVGLGLVWMLVGLWYFGRARSRQLDAAREQIGTLEGRLTAIAERVPNLSIGKAILPKESQTIELPLPGGETTKFLGRVIRVPVINARGAADAENVHARLTFLVGGKVDRQFGPTPTTAQWFSERGDTEFEVNLPANGRPRLIDVVLITDRPYPHAHEWTIHSRAALLRGYEVMSDRFRVKIDVEGNGVGALAPSLSRTLEIECGQGMLKANWLDRDPDEGTHWVGWGGKNM